MHQTIPKAKHWLGRSRAPDLCLARLSGKSVSPFAQPTTTAIMAIQISTDKRIPDASLGSGVQNSTCHYSRTGKLYHLVVPSDRFRKINFVKHSRHLRKTIGTLAQMPQHIILRLEIQLPIYQRAQDIVPARPRSIQAVWDCP